MTITAIATQSRGAWGGPDAVLRGLLVFHLSFLLDQTGRNSGKCLADI